MTKNKKIIIFALIGIFIVAIITTGTVIALNVINNNNTEKTKEVPTKKSADQLRLDAEKARANDDKVKSKELLIKAQEQYETLPENDENTNAKVDIDSQLWLLEHANTTPPAPDASTTPTTP